MVMANILTFLLLPCKHLWFIYLDMNFVECLGHRTMAIKEHLVHFRRVHVPEPTPIPHPQFSEDDDKSSSGYDTQGHISNSYLIEEHVYKTDTCIQFIHQEQPVCISTASCICLFENTVRRYLKCHFKILKSTDLN